MGRSWVRFPAAALSGNNLGQVVHTSVPLFTMQYNLVPCEGFHHVNASICGSIMGPMNIEQGEYCSSGSVASFEPRYKLYTLLFLLYLFPHSHQL